MITNKNNQNKKPPRMKRSQTITFWLVIILLVIVMFQVTNMGEGKSKEVSFSQFQQFYKNGNVIEAQINDKEVSFKTGGGQQYTTYLPFNPDSEFTKQLTEAGVNVSSQKPSQFLAIFLNFLPFLIFIGFWIFMMRGMRGGANQALNFGKSKARLSLGGKTNVTFKDVAGVDEAKEELEEIIDFLKAPKKFQSLGGRIPRGVMLLGRPGTGKTLLAKAVAGEAKVPFYNISGSDFVEMFVGVGASRVRNMFRDAKKNAPCIVFIDEIDAVGRHRGTGLGGGHDEREQTLNQLLVEMDGFEPNDSVIIIAATNRPDVLDPALLRPGRFDRQVVVDLPDIKGRLEILKVHTKKLPLAKDVSLQLVARGTPGFSGADLANLVNEAALLAARNSKKKIENNDFEEAKDKVTLGKARKSKVITEDDKHSTAIHEIGHVLCSVFLDKTEPIHKVTIIPRGFTGGATHFLQTDKSKYTKTYLEQSIVGLMGGRAAEELILKDISTGASNDIQRATDLAKQMVCKWGMSTEIGPMMIGKENSQVFLGKEINQQESMSEKTAEVVDSEIHKIMLDAYKQAKEILDAQREVLKELSEALLNEETLDADQIYQIVLKHVQGDEKKLVEKRYKMAKQMKIDVADKEEKKRIQDEIEKPKREES
jgi:cell division protease FtsH